MKSKKPKYKIPSSFPKELRRGRQAGKYKIRAVGGRRVKRHKFTKKACLGLWKFSTFQSNQNTLDYFSKNALSSFKNLTSFDDNNTFGIQKEAMEAIKEIINKNQHIGRESGLCEIIESALKPEVENHSYNKRTFSWGWFCIYESADAKIKEQVVSARNYAFDLYSLLIDKAGDTAYTLSGQQEAIADFAKNLNELLLKIEEQIFNCLLTHGKDCLNDVKNL
jgi:hypothetical protein